MTRQRFMLFSNPEKVWMIIVRFTTSEISYELSTTSWDVINTAYLNRIIDVVIINNELTEISHFQSSDKHLSIEILDSSEKLTMSRP